MSYVYSFDVELSKYNWCKHYFRGVKLLYDDGIMKIFKALYILHTGLWKLQQNYSKYKL